MRQDNRILTSQGHHIGETNLLERAVSGDSQGIQEVIQYLGSKNINLRRIMGSYLHDSRDPLVWRYLLGLLSIQKWVDALNVLGVKTPLAVSEPSEVPLNQIPIPSSRCLQSVAEAFAVDESEEERMIKKDVLNQALEKSGGIKPQEPPNDNARLVRYATAYLMALRGELQVIPVLETMIEKGEPEWKLRAIEALAVLHDARCGPPMLRALEMPDRQLHREASRALIEMGQLVQDTWLEALHHPVSHIRWHAARGLGQIGDPRAVQILAEGLFDENREVRWATADVLANLESTAIPAILHVITHHPLNEQFRRAAYHALHAMHSRQLQEYLAPLLDALRGSASSVKAPAVAAQMAAEWRVETTDKLN